MRTRRTKTDPNPWRSRLRPEDCTLLLIDLQEKFVPYLRNRRRVLRSTAMLLRVARELGIPVVVTEHNPERIGPTVPEIAAELARLPRHVRLRKDIFSCLGDGRVRRALARHRSRRTLLVAGCETHICVLQTTVDALAAGWRVFVAADGVSSRTELDWLAGLGRIERAGAVAATAEMISYELLGRSDTPEFKALLPVFKGWVAGRGARP
jgi:nicotinamidase-related amidase